MNSIAANILRKLLVSGNKAAAGVRTRPAALTKLNLKAYRELKAWHQKQECEETFLAARDFGALTFQRDIIDPIDGMIDRMDLVDVKKLAQFLGHVTHEDMMIEASLQFSPFKLAFPVLEDILQRWAAMGKVRGLDPVNTVSWMGAIQVIKACELRKTEAVLAPIREFSAQRFDDSKFIEKLTAQLDILLSGSIEAAPRPASEVWQELGLFREEQPALLAGQVVIERTRVTSLLDTPYGGFPTSTVMKVIGPLHAIYTIENLTTFHSEAKRRAADPVLLVYTGGMPSPAWRAMYRRLLASSPPETLIYHWGDVDEGGFRIAANLAETAAAEGRRLHPHLMSPKDVPLDRRRPASERTIARIRHFATAAGWADLGNQVADAKFTVEQEAL